MFRFRLTPQADMRLIEQHHAEEMWTLMQNNRAHFDAWMRWSGKVQSLEDVRERIQRFLLKFANNDGFQAGIWFNNQMVGGMVVHSMNWDSRKTEIGYYLSQEAVGKGLVTLACQATLDYLFDELKLHRVTIVAAAENTRSRAVAERLGFTLEGIERDSEWITTRYLDHALYSILEHEWREKQGRKS